jgi:hypothetical protein
VTQSIGDLLKGRSMNLFEDVIQAPSIWSSQMLSDLIISSSESTVCNAAYEKGIQNKALQAPSD